MALPPNLTIATDGSLLLTGGTHEVLAMCTGEKPSSDASVDAFWANHARRQAYCGARDIGYQMVVFPDKLVPYAGRISSTDRIVSPYLRDFAARRAHGGVLYPDVVATDYMRTDTHLSVQGLASVTRQVVEGVGIFDHAMFDAACDACQVVSKEHIGDLGSKCDPPICEEAAQFKGLGRGRYGSNKVSSGNFGIIDMNYNPAALQDQTVLLFGDSFFRQMLKCLTHYYSRIFFLRTRFFHDELVPAIKPDVIFGGCAERYLSEVQPDSERPHALALPLILGRGMDPTPNFAQLWNMLVDSKVLAGGERA